MAIESRSTLGGARLNAPTFRGQRLAGYGALMVRRAESMLATIEDL